MVNRLCGHLSCWQPHDLWVGDCRDLTQEEVGICQNKWAGHAPVHTSRYLYCMHVLPSSLRFTKNWIFEALMMRTRSFKGRILTLTNFRNACKVNCVIFTFLLILEKCTSYNLPATHMRQSQSDPFSTKSSDSSPSG